MSSGHGVAMCICITSVMCLTVDQLLSPLWASIQQCLARLFKCSNLSKWGNQKETWLRDYCTGCRRETWIGM